MRPATILNRALDVVFPPRCVTCSEFGSYICDACLAAATRAGGTRCPRCWSLEGADACLRHEPAFEALRATFTYAAAARDAVRALKFHGVSAIAPTMAVHMHQTLLDWSPPVDAVVPVPLGGHRKRTRGYNQSELLARELSRLTGLPIETQAIRRVRATRPQTEQPDEAARRRNVADAFAPGRRSAPRRVLLIDDVTTTGATLDACARALLAAGASQVYALTFARED